MLLTRNLRRLGGFTLLELLVVMAIIALLAAMLLPALSRAQEKAKVARASAELRGVGLALQMYSDDTQGRLPPVRVNCNTDLATHWCQFPVELVEQHYLGPGNKPGMAANMEDVFNPNHTYKYAAPGPQLLNGAPGGNYQLWVPDDLPTCASTNGQYYSNPKDSPVRWVIWSLGPQTRQRAEPGRTRPDGPPKLVSPHRRGWRHCPLRDPRRHSIPKSLAANLPRRLGFTGLLPLVIVCLVKSEKNQGVVRFTVSVPQTLARQLDRMTREKGYDNRSLAVADMIRDQLVEHRQNYGDRDIAGTITLVYDHHKQHVQATLTDIQHDHHEVIISTLHVHLDHDNCLEVLAVRGKAGTIKKIADELIAAKGVKHGKLTVTTSGKDLPS